MAITTTSKKKCCTQISCGNNDLKPPPKQLCWKRHTRGGHTRFDTTQCVWRCLMPDTAPRKVGCYGEFNEVVVLIRVTHPYVSVKDALAYEPPSSLRTGRSSTCIAILCCKLSKCLMQNRYRFIAWRGSCSRLLFCASARTLPPFLDEVAAKHTIR